MDPVCQNSYLKDQSVEDLSQMLAQLEIKVKEVIDEEDAVEEEHEQKFRERKQLDRECKFLRTYFRHVAKDEN